MNNTTTVNEGRVRIGQQEKNLEMVSSESTVSATNETDFVLSDTEKTFQTETTSKSYRVNNGFSECISLVATLLRRILRCVNNLGGSEIDVHRMESGRREHLGLRKWNL